MTLIKTDAIVNVELDSDAKQVVLIYTEETGYKVKILFDAAVAYKVGCKLEAYALKLQEEQ